MWRMNCEQLKVYDDMIPAKEEELLSMGVQVIALESSTPRGTRALHIESVPPEGRAATILPHTSCDGVPPQGGGS